MRLLTIIMLVFMVSCGGSKRTNTESTSVIEEKKVDSVSYKERVVEEVYLPSSYMSTFKIKLDSLGNIEPIVFKSYSGHSETSLSIDREGNITLEGSTEELKSTSMEVTKETSRDEEIYEKNDNTSTTVKVKRPFPTWLLMVIIAAVVILSLRFRNRIRF